MIEFSHQTCGDAVPHGRPRTPRGAGQAGPRHLWSGCPGPGDGFVSGQTEPHVRICSGTALSQTLCPVELSFWKVLGSLPGHHAEITGTVGWGGLPDPTGLSPRTRGTSQSQAGTCSQNPLREGACRFHKQQRGASCPAQSGPAPAPRLGATCPTASWRQDRRLQCGGLRPSSQLSHSHYQRPCWQNWLSHLTPL